MSRTMPQVPLLVEFPGGKHHKGQAQKVSLLSKMARSVLPVYAVN